MKMMIMRYSLIVFFTAVCVRLTAQKLRGGISTGLNIAYLQTEDVQTNAMKFSFSLPAGILLNKTINKWYGLQAEINYIRMGERIDGMQQLSADALNIGGLPPGSCTYASFRSNISIHYLQMPLLLKASIQVHPAVTYYALIGPAVSILADSKLTLRGNSLLYADLEGRLPLETDMPQAVSFDHIIPLNKDLKTLILSGIGAAGLQINIRNGSFFLETRLTEGFSNIYRRSHENYTNALACMLGYTFIIK